MFKKLKKKKNNHLTDLQIAENIFYSPIFGGKPKHKYRSLGKFLTF